MKKETSDFYRALVDKFPLGKRERSFIKIEERSIAIIAQYLSNISTKAFKRIVSDPHWNSYPLYTYNYRNNSGVINNRSYASIFSFVVRYLVYTSPAHKKALIEHSTGIFRINTINHCLGKDKLRAARVSLKLGDIRAKKISVDLLPVNDIAKHLLIENNRDIKGKILRRVGYMNLTVPQSDKIDNRYEKGRIMLNNGFDKEAFDEILTNTLNLAKQKKAKLEQNILQKISYHVSDSDALFYLDLFQYVSSSTAFNDKQIFLRKLTGKDDV